MQVNNEEFIVRKKPKYEPSLATRTVARTATRLAEPLGTVGSIAQHIPEGTREITGIPFLPERGNLPVSALLGDIGTGLEAARRAYNFVSGQNIPEPTIPLPTQEGITQKAEELATEKFGNTDILKPQNVIENIADRFVSYIPQTLALGIAGIPTNLSNLFASSVAGGGLESAGFGPAAQGIGEFFAGLGTSAAKLLSKIPGSVTESAKSLQNKSFNTGMNIGKKIPINQPDQAQKLGKLYNEVTGNPTYKKQTKNVINYVNDLMQGNASLQDIWKSKQRIDKLYKSAGPDKPVYQQARSILDEALKLSGLENPEFGKHYYTANDITQGIINANKSANIIKNSPSILSKLSHPVALTYAVRSMLKGDITTGIKAIAGSIAANYVKDKYDVIKSLYQSSPTIKNILVDMSSDAALKDKSLMTRLAAQLNNEVEKQFPMEKEEFIVRKKS